MRIILNIPRLKRPARESEKQTSNMVVKQETPPRGRVYTEYCLDIGKAHNIRKVDLDEPPPYWATIKKPLLSHWPMILGGRVPYKLVVRKENQGGNGTGPSYEFADPYELTENDEYDTPQSLYNDIKSPEFAAILKPKAGLWQKIQTGLYMTALLVLAAIVVLVVIILLGE